MQCFQELCKPMLVCFISTRSKMFYLTWFWGVFRFCSSSEKTYLGFVIVACALPFVFPPIKGTTETLLSTSLLYFCCSFPFNCSGIIRTALADMDREAREHYTVVIQAKDMAGQVGGLSGSTTINITLTDINDNPPKFPQSRYKRLNRA